LLTITERAAQELKAILAAKATDPSHVLRIDTENDGFSLWLGPEVKGDSLMGSEETVILRVSPELNRFMVKASLIIDCRDTTDGPRLIVYHEGDPPPPEAPAKPRRSASRAPAKKPVRKPVKKPVKEPAKKRRTTPRTPPNG
jgi:hypothetical protein